MSTKDKSAKQLAIEKGLFRVRGRKRRGLTGSTPSNSASDDAQLRYLVVIDFESTCWADVATERFVNQRVQHPQEIIEFPAVVVDLRNGHVDSENSFHLYVQPEERPTLSAFCTRLTGIAQATVDNALPLRACLPRFNKWLKDVQTKFNFTFAQFDMSNRDESDRPSVKMELGSVATWTDWDLGRMLHNECKRKGLRYPPELSAWVDLKLLYRDFYGRKPAGLNGALKDIGMVFDGREHSGIDDAINTAHLAARMSSDGCRITQTKSLTGALSK